MSGKIGLVLSGGGAKGAYEIGVCKALSAMGADKYIDTIAGTSVGALNAVLLESQGTEYSEKIWNNLTIDDLLNVDWKRITKFPRLPDYSDPDYIGLRPDNIVDSIFLGGKSLYKSLKKENAVTDFVKNGLPFNQERISQLIDENVYFDRLTRKIFVACCDIDGEVKYFHLNLYPPHIQKKIVLASSALPVVYTGACGININGTDYFDGGIAGDESNTPISCLYNNGCRSIIAVHLKHDANLINQYCDFQGRYHYNKNNYYTDNNDIINIIPSKNLGGMLTGTLNLNNMKVKRDIELGYHDTYNHMDEIFSMIKNL